MTIEVASPRAIIDRRAIGDRLHAVRPSKRASADVTSILREALEDGRAEIVRRLTEEPGNGRAAAQATAYLHGQLVRLIYDFTVERLAEPLREPLALVALGGTGRGEMAPFSDLDLMFLTAKAPAPEHERLSEAILHILWDLKLKVGHSLRSVPQLIALSRKDMTVRTAFLEGRWLWGDEKLFDAAMRRFRKEVVAGTAAEFVTAKLAERDERHVRMGDTRYVVEPNVKEGKGGLRDLQTLYWIGKYIHGVERPAELVKAGLLTAAEFRKFDRAERFFWSVRCHLHLLAGRAEERLSFDYQPRIAEIMHYADRPGKSAVERFMQFYFLNAKAVGDLTGVFLAQLDEQQGKKGFRFALPTIRRRPRRLGGFVLERGRISIPGDDFFRTDPLRLLELFALAARERLEIHPTAMRAAARDAVLIDPKLRADSRANALFMEVLTSVDHPETVLRWMNETGVFGRFVPDFGRVVAQMQFDMYHHYTVDEHSIRAIGLLAAIERGDLKNDHPLSTSILNKQVASRRVLYVAVLLHDIAKGRRGDHSILGAEVAHRARAALWPRPGGDRNRLLVGAPPFADVVHRVQTRPRRSQDDRGFRPSGAEPGAAAPAADPDRGRHSRGRAGHLERLEADASSHPVRSSRGAAPSRAQAARPDRAGRAAPARAGDAAGLESERRQGAREAVARQLLARRTALVATRQCAPSRGGGNPFRRRPSQRRRR